MNSPILKLTFISGLKNIVLDEIKKYENLHLIKETEYAIYLENVSDFKNVLSLKSINSAYIVRQDTRFNPKHINKHKSLLGDLIDVVLKENKQKNSRSFSTFKLRCAGSQSPEIQEIQDYIKDTFKLKNAIDAELEIYISKLEDIWEISIRLSSRPLSVRDYKIENIKGGLNPNLAYTMNSFCNLDSIKSYLNIFSGSATLLIEAGLINSELKLIGYDIDKKTNSLAIQNIKKANLIKNIQIKTADIFNNPDFGKFDAITSNLPFGMQVSKGEDLNKLYQQFIDYSEKTLNPKGRLIIYTTESEILNNILEKSKFKVIDTLEIIIPTSINSYLYPSIFVCDLT